MEIDERAKYGFIKIGAKVRWEDPGIDDFCPEDREERLNMEWVVDVIVGVDEESVTSDDDIVFISSEYSEAEVLPCELKPFK